MELSFSTDHPDQPPHYPDGIDITISLTPREAHALGNDALGVTDTTATILAALVGLRTGLIGDDPEPPTVARWWNPILSDIESHLALLQGIRNAVIRHHYNPAAEGSLADLGRVWGLHADSRSTAQSRRSKVLDAEPSPGEYWATGTQPPQADQER